MSEYNIDLIQYRTQHGALIAEEPMIFKRLHGIGEIIFLNYIGYEVVGVAIADNIQHVNMTVNADTI